MQPFQGSAREWDDLIASLPQAHLLQTWTWSQVKAKYGWQPLPFVWEDSNRRTAAAVMLMKKQVLRRGFAAKLCVIYASKGPMLDWSDSILCARVLDDLQSYAKKQGAIFLKIDPDLLLGMGVAGQGDAVDHEDGRNVAADLKQRGWSFSSDQIQFRNTVLIDLSASEDEMLARMKQKTRYNVRLAEKKGVAVRAGTLDDLPLLYNMYAETSVRDGFVIRDQGYYQTVWQTFMAASPAAGHPPPVTRPPSPAPRHPSLDPRPSLPFAVPLIAEVDGQPVAAVFLFVFADRAYYVYGMSREAHREKMPAYLLQWEAIKRAKASGCTVYDLWGAPDEFNERDGMWGVYRFKEGLGGRVARTLGAWDFAPNALWYGLYTRVMPRLLDLMRSRGRAKTQESLG